MAERKDFNGAGSQGQEVWTIGRILKWTEGYFKKAGLDSPRLDAEVLLSHVLKKERIFLYVHFDQPMEAAELAAYKDCIKRRVQHQPVAYITGHKEFMGLDFRVTPATLIPRPDTEILVEAVLQRLKAGTEAEGSMIADIGTGSGAICLSLLNYLPRLQAVTVDISPEALAVAEENARELGLSERAEFLQGDMLVPLKAQSARFSGRLAAMARPASWAANRRRSSEIIEPPPLCTAFPGHPSPADPACGPHPQTGAAPWPAPGW